MFLKDSESIRAAILNLIANHNAEEPIGMAVAFWGEGAEEMLPSGQQFRLICNLTMGGTNPAVIEHLRVRPGIEIRQLPDLHAKVVLTSGGAVVSSANFSSNGLGIEGETCRTWREAGILVSTDSADFVSVVGWFHALWRQAQTVTTLDLAAVLESWQGRTTSVPKVCAEPPVTVEAERQEKDENEERDLTEDDLFESKLKKANSVRMASDWLVEEYRRMRGGRLEKRDHYIPAYAAHMLWTLSGQTMATNIRTTPEFSRPDHVFRRIEDMREDPDKVRNLIARVARSSSAPTAVRYWAARFGELRL